MMLQSKVLNGKRKFYNLIFFTVKVTIVYKYTCLTQKHYVTFFLHKFCITMTI